VNGARVAAPRRLHAALAAAWLLAAALYLFGAHGFALSEPDEGRYGEIAREMVESGDWVTPRLNYVLYFEKPPLVYWSSALAFRQLGQSELAARLPSVVAALLTLLLTGWLARRLYGAPTALLAVACLAAGPLFGVLAVVLTLDMALTACLTLAMCCAWRVLGEAGGRGWVRAAYAATALAILVKGPVAALLAGGTVLLFALLHGGVRAVRAWLDWRALVLACVIALPWFLLVGARNPTFWHFFIVDQHLTRYLSTREHGEPLWFFAPILPLALAPWSLVVLFDAPALRRALDPRTWASGTRFCALWAAVIVVFFSASASKLVTYVLPALPPLAILTARAVQWLVARGRTAGLTRVGWLMLIGGLVMGACAALLPWLTPHWRAQALAPFLYAGALPLAATGLLTGRCVARGRTPAALGVLGIGWALVFAIALAGRGAANEYRALGVAARAAMQPDDRLALYHNYVQGMPFYTHRRAVVVGGPGELLFGSRFGDQAAWFWPTDDVLLREWRGAGRLFLVINRDDLDRLRPAMAPPPIEVADKGKKVLVANRR
jgi:4-amino-4-deoxy-L-arabinose transferase-like glycosyltransferase